MEYSNVFSKLSKSKFRSKFKLSKKDIDLIEKKGVDKIESHCSDLLMRNVSSLLKNDGKQTPYKGHPVFVAMHATGTCCRDCMQKWYGIPKNRKLTKLELVFFKGLIMEWIFQKALQNQIRS